MRNLLSLSLLATTVSLVASQQTWVPTSGSSTFPQCAVSCPVLLQAQKLCSPPSAIVSTQITYENCFCQAPTVQDLYTTGETICTNLCTTTADRQLMSTWFTSFCKQVGNGVDPVAGTGTGTSTNTASTSSASTAATQTVDLQSSNSTQSNQPWITTHWQWIIMLIFLTFGLLALGLGARWLKKRHDQGMEKKRATMSGFPVTSDKRFDREAALTVDIWGPHQHMAATQGYQYKATRDLSVIAESSGSSNADVKQNGRIEVTELQPVRSSARSQFTSFFRK